MADRPLAVVLNPNAGGGAAAREWPRLEAELARRGLPYTLIRETSGPNALAQVRRLPKDATVLAVGGDGTVRSILPALDGTGRRLALLPLGTGNDFAGMLGLPPGDHGAALDRLTAPVRRVDALDVRIVSGEGQGERHTLLNGLGLGFDAQVTLNMARAPAQLRGFSRYAWSAVTTLRDLRLHGVTVTVDGEPLYTGPSALVAVMNGTRYGGGFRISPQGDASDGLLNALCSGPVTRLHLATLMIAVLRGGHLGHPRVHHRAGKGARIRWDTPTPLHLDGDLRGLVTELTVRVKPGAICLLA